MKNVTFYLGPASDLTSRTLTIVELMRAGQDNETTHVTAVLAGTAETTTQECPDNRVLQAKLVDVTNGGVSSVTDVLNFQTGDLQFPGPKSGDRLSILSMEDLSSSSSSSSESSQSSSSSSSESSMSSSSSSSSSSVTSSSSSSSQSSSSSSSVTSSSSSSSSSP